ncbi:MAG: transposase [bacterium]
MKENIKYIYNRGINKDEIFINNYDKERFLICLYKFNNVDKSIRDRSKEFFNDPYPQKKLVEILKWTLMPNQYHLILKEKVPGGITEFIRRLSNGYTRYFNINHNKKGYLFEGRTQMVKLETKEQFLYLPLYVDLAPLDQYYPNWRKIGVHNPEKALELLADYDWSSFYDYSHDEPRDYRQIINKQAFFDSFRTTQQKYREELLKLMKEPMV